MPTVVDELIVVLGLDATKFNQGQKEAVEKWTKAREAHRKGAQEIESSTTAAANAVLGLSQRLLGLGAIFLGGLGIEKFVTDIRKVSQELTVLGKTAENTGTSTQNLFTFGAAGRALGGTSQEVIQSIRSLERQMSSFSFQPGPGSIMPLFSLMGISDPKNKNPQQLMEEMNAYANRQLRAGKSKSDVSTPFERMGMSEATINLLLLPTKQFKEMMETFRKYAPTDEQVKRATSLQLAIAKVDEAMGSLGRQILNNLAPPLEKLLGLIERLANMVKAAIPDTPKSLGDITSPEGLAERKQKGHELADKLRGWWKGSSLNPIGSANAATGSEGTRSGGIGSEGNINIGGGGLAADRAKYFEEMKNNPEVRRRLLAISAAENNDPKANLAVMETMMNRAGARGTTLAEQLKFYGREKGGYYPTANYSALNDPRKMALYEANLERARGGSNVSNYATDNSSGSLAYRDEVSGAFIKTMPTQNGESFFSPGNRGRGSASRESYLKWRRNVEQSSNGAANSGPDPGFYSDWLTNASTRNLMRQSNITTNNNRTSSETTIGSLNVHTQATDAFGIMRDLKPYLENNKVTAPANYGPN
jgi:hypothetical protein